MRYDVAGRPWKTRKAAKGNNEGRTFHAEGAPKNVWKNLVGNQSGVVKGIQGREDGNGWSRDVVCEWNNLDWGMD